jgi:hypothetical protein
VYSVGEFISLQVLHTLLQMSKCDHGKFCWWQICDYEEIIVPLEDSFRLEILRYLNVFDINYA